MSDSKLELIGAHSDAADEILSAAAMDFIGCTCTAEFRPRAQELLALRKQRQADIDSGVMPDFLPETAEIRAADWSVTAVPGDLADRRVEITGPTDRKKDHQRAQLGRQGSSWRTARTR